MLHLLSIIIKSKIESNYVTCAEYKCRPYREMLTYKPLTLLEVLVQKIFTK
jgi:hypothetical protein